MTHDERKAYWSSWYSRNRKRILQKRRRQRNRDAVNKALREYRRDNQARYLAQASRDPFYRKLRRSGIDRNQAARAAGITLQIWMPA